MPRRSILLACGAVAVSVSACGNDDQPWHGDADRITNRPASVAPASTTLPDEPPMATNPADAPSPGGTNPDGSTLGTTADDDAASEAVRQDNAAMLTLRTALSIIEGCHSGRRTYVDCDEQAELGSAKQLGVTFGTADGGVQVFASPRSVRLTTRSASGARYTVARSTAGDRFSCQPGLQGGACPDTRTWSW
ncbi:MAG: hypothetical protein QM679_07785 [Patulibacter sp.]